MKTPVWLRMGSLLSLVLAAGHTLGGRTAWSPGGDTAVLRAMRSFHFDAMGAQRTYLDFYLGFGFLLSIYLLLQAVLLWQLAALTGIQPKRVRAPTAAFLLASVASAAVAWQFLFVVPAVFCLAIAICLAGAYVAAGKAQSA